MLEKAAFSDAVKACNPPEEVTSLLLGILQMPEGDGFLSSITEVDVRSMVDGMVKALQSEQQDGAVRTDAFTPAAGIALIGACVCLHDGDSLVFPSLVTKPAPNFPTLPPSSAKPAKKVPKKLDEKPRFFTFTSEAWLIDYSTGEHTKVEKGRYSIVLVENPYDHEAPWYVISGTTIGAACQSFLDNEGTYEEGTVDKVQD